MGDQVSRHRAKTPPAKKATWRAAGAMVAVLTVGTTALVVANELRSSGSGETTRTPTKQPYQPPGKPYRAFEANSWWNKSLPDDAPTDPNATEILDYMRTADENGGGCLKLAGAEENRWGQPIYWTKPSDPTYDVEGVANNSPRELQRLRIPAGAQSASNSDGTMSIFDLDAGYVTALTDADYDADSDEWTASGATVTYLRSNGLHVLTGESDDDDNTGTHRGNNGATMAARWDMVNAGAITHVLKVASGPEVANRWVFPMVGSDGGYDGDDPAVPPQGLRFRIKPTIDLDSFELPPQAEVIARALQRYGFYIGDSGGTTSLKLEDTETEGRGDLWDVSANDLCSLPFTPAYWDVIAEGYDPSDER